MSSKVTCSLVFLWMYLANRIAVRAAVLPTTARCLDQHNKKENYQYTGTWQASTRRKTQN